MSITTVALCNRIGRRARGGDFTKLSMNEQMDIMEAANHALQRLYGALPAYFKEMTEGFVLPAPLAVAGVGVTQYGKTVTGITFTSAQFGQTIVLSGDAGWNQIVGTNELLNPYMGSTGTVAGTIYGNALFSNTYPFDRVIGNPTYANQSIGILLNASMARNNAGANQWLMQQNVGVPVAWWPQVFGNSQGNSPMWILRFAPAPQQAYAVNVRLSFWPKRLTLTDYDSNTSLPVPDQFIEPSLIPMAIQAFMSSPAWASRRDEALVEDRGNKGEAFARNQPGQFAAPNNQIYTPVGF